MTGCRDRLRYLLVAIATGFRFCSGFCTGCGCRHFPFAIMMPGCRDRRVFPGQFHFTGSAVYDRIITAIRFAGCVCPALYDCTSSRMTGCRNRLRIFMTTENAESLFWSICSTGRFLRCCPVSICMWNFFPLCVQCSVFVEGNRSFIRIWCTAAIRFCIPALKRITIPFEWILWQCGLFAHRYLLGLHCPHAPVLIERHSSRSLNINRKIAFHFGKTISIRNVCFIRSFQIFICCARICRNAYQFISWSNIYNKIDLPLSRTVNQPWITISWIGAGRILNAGAAIIFRFIYCHRHTTAAWDCHISQNLSAGSTHSILIIMCNNSCLFTNIAVTTVQAGKCSESFFCAGWWRNNCLIFMFTNIIWIVICVVKPQRTRGDISFQIRSIVRPVSLGIRSS